MIFLDMVISADCIKLIRIIHKWRNIYLISLVSFRLDKVSLSLYFKFQFFTILLDFIGIFLLKPRTILMSKFKVYILVFFLCFLYFFHYSWFICNSLKESYLFICIRFHSLSFMLLDLDILSTFKTVIKTV